MSTIGILGLGRSGLGAARLALVRGAAVYASDTNDSPDLRAAADDIRRRGGDAEVGQHSIERLAGCDLIVVSPGIPPTAAVLRDDRLSGVRVVSELEFAFRHLDAPVIGITGTNGKSTTTALTAHLLQAAELDAPAAGNIGLALSEIAVRADPPDWVVVEASSFQLAGIESFAPRVGVVTNLSPDHLDRYPTIESYYADKARLFDNATPSSIWVLNGEDTAVLALPGDAPGERRFFRTSTALADGEQGGWIREDTLVVRYRDDEIPLVRTDELRILGRHNHANALAASLAALAAGADSGAVRIGLRSFPGLAHRLEVVADAGDVLWINDSKATNIDSTRVALRSMMRPVVVLLGGRHKGEPYDALLPEIASARGVVAYGEARDRIAADLGGQVRVASVRGPFEAAVDRAASMARPGDAILLSPACSSYDMFRDYEERGARFTALARARADAFNG